MSKICTISTVVLNQWALDFQGNFERIQESIQQSKIRYSRYRNGPELEISGYGCEDHFNESDTLLHCWQVLDKILGDKENYEIVLDIGMPVGHRGFIYNCRVICLNGKILLIRPKQVLAKKEVFREDRWFAAWTKLSEVDVFVLPDFIDRRCQQKTVPFGDALLCFNDTCVGIETCHELWVQNSPNIRYYDQGAELIFNGNGSNHILRKLGTRLSLLEAATKKCGGVYVYTNLRGCDSERVYYDGGAMIALNGNIVAQGKQFSLNDVEVVVANVDLDQVRTYRYLNSNSMTENSKPMPRIQVDFNLCVSTIRCDRNISPSPVISQPISISPEQELSIAPALWLWDHLRRSRLNGFFLPLSGGLDSSSVACLVYSMCRMLVQAVNEDNNEQVLSDIRRTVQDTSYKPSCPRELCSRLLVTCYMSTEHSSTQTKHRATKLAENIGSSHLHAIIDTIVRAILLVACACLGMSSNPPKFKSQGGTNSENLALQNIQARIRMVLAYLLAQLYHWSRHKTGGLLVLASGNLDECLRGYLTKYDCSSADLNPIGSICKEDLRMLIRYCHREFGLEILQDIVEAVPTAELEPLDPSNKQLIQTDEVDMGMTYAQLSVYGKLRKIECCGPYSMFIKLMNQPEHFSMDKSRDRQALETLRNEVRHFFVSYSRNRHKMTVATPAYHVESYDCEDNRYDLRPFLYNNTWQWQFQAIDNLIGEICELPWAS